MYNFITLKELRPKLPGVIDRIDAHLDRFIIARHGQPVAILLSLDDFESLLETLNEQEDKENMRKIRRGIREARSGRTVNWKKVKKKYKL